MPNQTTRRSTACEDTAPSSGCEVPPSDRSDTADSPPVQADPAPIDPPDQEQDAAKPSPVNIRNFSIKCGRCDQYQTIVAFRVLDDDWNEYAYECESPPCAGDPSQTRTLLEVPADLDEYARRDPTWHGGEVHAGAKHGVDED